MGLNTTVMIAVGGLSGGFGLMIAGGDFWTGAGQGLITSGLNHALHRLGLKNTYPVDEELNELGLNPNDSAPFSMESVEKVEGTKSIQKILKNVSKPRVELGGGEGHSNYYPNKATIVMRKRDFISWRRLATSYGHEIVHRYVDMHYMGI